jgi:L-alanine-DL-glutamate epimerase-like enolase superfamily enzyme
VSNRGRMINVWPFFVHQVAPFLVGKDARDLDRLVDDVYSYDSNYKYQSLALWLPVASAEFAILDLLGQVAGRSVGELVGEVLRTSIDAYRANNFRGLSAEESVRNIVERHVAENSRAVKIKLGGRMDLPEVPPGRSEQLIPLVREALGDDVTIYADANGSYDVAEAVRIGRLLEEINAGFYEEPCPFDWHWETKEVADALSIPVAGGEQEGSMRSFRWMVLHDGLQVFQPDLFYFGGLIRSMKVARMAEAVGKPCTPHMSGWGLGMLYVLHYASVVPNPGPYQEYKGINPGIPFESTSDLAMTDGQVSVPTGPGWGVKIDPDWIARSVVITRGEI